MIHFTLNTRCDYVISACESIVCGYFCVGFIDFMLKGKRLLDYTIFGKGGHTPPPPNSFFWITPTPFIRCPTFHMFIRKTKVLNNSCNQFVYNFYPQSILILEECLQKW